MTTRTADTARLRDGRTPLRVARRAARKAIEDDMVISNRVMIKSGVQRVD